MQKKKLMLIDDEIDLTVLLKIELEEEGFEVHIANDGLTGLEMIKKILPDLVLLDISMPGMNGYDVLKNVKNDPETKHIPIFLLTAKGLAEEAQKGIELGADDYIPKPFQGALLVKKVADTLIRFQDPSGVVESIDSINPETKNILIVEDSPTERKLFESTLNKTGYNVFTADNGEDGLEMISKVNPDIVLLDIHMPKLDGHEVLKRLKSDATKKNIPVIIITSSGLDSTVQRMIEAGAVDYMIKPIPLELLLKRIEIIIG